MDTEELETLIEDIDVFFSIIEDGDKFINSDPNKEYGLQFDLYCYLKNLGYNLVYELSLLDLKPYLDKELKKLNEGYEGYPEDSLRPDLVIKLDIGGFVCIELKYNEQDDTEIIEDIAKCRVYVQQCQDVHYAKFIHLSKDIYKNLELGKCRDNEYHYSFYEVWDNLIYQNGLPKSANAYPIAKLWKKKLDKIENGRGEFSDFE